VHVPPCTLQGGLCLCQQHAELLPSLRSAYVAVAPSDVMVTIFVLHHAAKIDLVLPTRPALERARCENPLGATPLPSPTPVPAAPVVALPSNSLAPGPFVTASLTSSLAASTAPTDVATPDTSSSAAAASVWAVLGLPPPPPLVPSPAPSAPTPSPAPSPTATPLAPPPPLSSPVPTRPLAVSPEGKPTGEEPPQARLSCGLGGRLDAARTPSHLRRTSIPAVGTSLAVAPTVPRGPAVIFPSTCATAVPASPASSSLSLAHPAVGLLALGASPPPPLTSPAWHTPTFSNVSTACPRVLFASYADMLLVYLPGRCLHLVDCGPEHAPLDSLHLTGPALVPFLDTLGALTAAWEPAASASGHAAAISYGSSGSCGVSTGSAEFPLASLDHWFPVLSEFRFGPVDSPGPTHARDIPHSGGSASTAGAGNSVSGIDSAGGGDMPTLALALRQPDITGHCFVDHNTQCVVEFRLDLRPLLWVLFGARPLPLLATASETMAAALRAVSKRLAQSPFVAASAASSTGTPSAVPRGSGVRGADALSGEPTEAAPTRLSGDATTPAASPPVTNTVATTPLPVLAPAVSATSIVSAASSYSSSASTQVTVVAGTPLLSCSGLTGGTASPAAPMGPDAVDEPRTLATPATVVSSGVPGSSPQQQQQQQPLLLSSPAAAAGSPASPPPTCCWARPRPTTASLPPALLLARATAPTPAALLRLQKQFIHLAATHLHIDMAALLVPHCARHCPYALGAELFKELMLAHPYGRVRMYPHHPPLYSHNRAGGRFGGTDHRSKVFFFRNGRAQGSTVTPMAMVVWSRVSIARRWLGRSGASE